MVGFEMTNSTETLHPGRILLLQAMEPLGISRNQLARDIDVPVGRISDITNGKRGITADTALRLGRYFGTGPELWLRLQAEYDLHVARKTTWPAVESRVRVLTTNAAGEAPVAPEAEKPVASLVETPAAAPVVDLPAPGIAAAASEPPAETEPEPLADELPHQPDPDPDPDPDTGAEPDADDRGTAELYEPAGFRTEPDAPVEEDDHRETRVEASEPAPGGDVSDDVEPDPGNEPSPFAEREADLGIPPIPDRSKLYQSG
jgi:addiction module HigA family antidote